MINKKYFQKTNYIPGSRYNLENNNTLKVTYLEVQYGDLCHLPGEILEPHKEEVLNLINNFCLEHLLSNQIINIIFDYDNIVLSSSGSQKDYTIWYESYYEEE